MQDPQSRQDLQDHQDRRVDVLLLLQAGPEPGCDARRLRRNLQGTAGVSRVVEARAGQGRLLRVEHDPARLNSAHLLSACEEAGCRVKLIGL